MLEIKDKSKCCGCEACANICPKKCISMKEDIEGFRYPNINKEKCINCGACNKVCPILNEVKKEDKSTSFYCAYNKDYEIVKSSSSGGIFWTLVQYILDNNGVVYGVVQNGTYDIKYIRAETEDECMPMRGSKYLQANVNDTYLNVRKDLEEGRYVLFSGTPCQVAAVYKFLGKEYERLFTIDVVCHGVPSMAVYREYIKYMEEKRKEKVINVKWRDKIKGKWGPNHVTIMFDNGSTSTTTSIDNPFQRGFLYNLYLRPSCYECKYAKLPRIGDISLADFWQYNGKFKRTNKNRGLSAMIISSEKGEKLFQCIKNSINYHPVEKEYLTSRSRHVYIHPERNENRELFYKDFHNIPFEKLCKKYKIKLSEIEKVIEFIFKRLRNIKWKMKKNMQKLLKGKANNE